MIRAQDFSYSYPATTVEALAGITFEVNPGEFVAVVGANASGKSTLMYALAGFIPQFFGGDVGGGIVIAGVRATELGVDALAGEVGLVFQDPFNQITGARFSVREEVAFGLENLGVPRDEMTGRVDDILALTGLKDLADRSPYALSGGQQQRLALASVMVMDPKLLVLDEPTSQLDPVGTHEVFQTLHSLKENRGITVVMAEHKLEWIASFAERVLVLDQGHLVLDSEAREVLTSSQARKSGVGETRYTHASRLAIERDVVAPRNGLPVTLDEAREFFR
jgi:energy-coupling factor transporter ATP-binding protein EcfA2